MLALTVGILGLFVGPLVTRVGRGSTALRSGVDGFATTLVVGASVLWLLPHALEHAGSWALLGGVVGVSVPIALHRLGAEQRWIGLGLVLLGVHVVVDGAVLAVTEGTSSAIVAVAVAAHRIPVGMAVAHQATSQARAAATLGVLGGLTALGFALGGGIPPLVSDTAHGTMEAAVVGVLLHVVLLHAPAAAAPVERPSLVGATFSAAGLRPMVLAPQASCGHDHACGHRHGPGPGTQGEARASAVGVLLGLALLTIARVAVAPDAGDHLAEAGEAMLALTLASAPALLAGFVFAGVLSAVIQPVHVQGGGPFGQALRGVLFGLPLPICSCGVVPMYQSLIRRGVPITAGLAFLVATPELGLDTLFLSLPLLGLPLTLARVLAALVVALVVAWLVGSAAPHDAHPSAGPPHDDAPLGERLREGLRYGLVDLVDHTFPWVLLGLGAAALAEPLVDHGSLAAVPALLQVPLAALVGVPLYVCASGATPLAAVAIHKGLSAGAGLTFLLAGPASNLTTFGVLSRLHGRGLALRFGLVLTLVAVLIGWTVDVVGVEVPMVAHPGSLETHHHGWLSWLSLALLVAIGLASLFRMGARGVLEQILDPVHAH